ncbi:MAG TPA: hypothetical protein VGD56_19420, partial [Gemmatirosa sp.]
DLLRTLGPGALVWAPSFTDVASTGDLGVTVGTATVRAAAAAPGASAADVSYSKYLTVWRRGRDGTWRVAADGGNPTPHR